MNIIITGASKGIGYETVKQLAFDRKNTVIAMARTKTALEQLQAECLRQNAQAKVFCFAFDLEKGDYKTLVSEIGKRISSVDVLVNNAGMFLGKAFEYITEAELLRTFNVNVFSVFKLTQQLLPLMNHNSHIVNISSIGGMNGTAKFPGFSAYSSNKGALAILTECLAEELKSKGIVVNCLALGAVQTEMLEKAFPNFKAPVTAEQMAKFVTDFAKNGNKYFNGKVLPVSLSTP